MNKLILLAVFVAVASARIGHWPIFSGVGNATNPTGLVIEGFNDFFQIYNDTDIDKCANIPLLADINKTLTDLNATHPNPVALIEDAVHLYGDFNKLKASCPQVASIFRSFFSTFITAMQKSPKNTTLTVIKNVASHQAEFQGLISQGSAEYNAGQYYQAGYTLGNVTSIVLDGYLPK